MLVLTFFWNYTYDEKLSVILPKEQSGIWKKKKAKNKASNNADLKQKKDRFRSNYQST